MSRYACLRRIALLDCWSVPAAGGVLEPSLCVFEAGVGTTPERVDATEFLTGYLELSMECIIDFVG